MNGILINGCARCGENHYMDFMPLNNPSDGYNWFGMCPILNQPILLKSAEKVKDKFEIEYHWEGVETK